MPDDVGDDFDTWVQKAAEKDAEFAPPNLRQWQINAFKRGAMALSARLTDAATE